MIKKNRIKNATTNHLLFVHTFQASNLKYYLNGPSVENISAVNINIFEERQLLEYSMKRKKYLTLGCNRALFF